VFYAIVVDGMFFKVLEQLRTKPIMIASHRRSGTHLTVDLFRRQFRECRSWKFPGERNDRLYVNLDMVLDRNKELPPSVACKILRRTAKALLKTHRIPSSNNKDTLQSFAQKDLSQLFEKADIVYVYRDGREVMSSYHQYRKGFDPKARCSLAEFMRQDDSGVSRVKFWANHVQSWLSLSGVITLKYDEVINNTQATLRRLGSAFQMEPLYLQPLLPKPLENQTASRCSRLFRIRPESTAILAPGEKENWRVAFTLSDRQFFHDEAGTLLIELGYESSSGWVTEQECSPHDHQA